MSLLEGSDPREKLKRTYKDTMITNWTVWPFVQAINFKMVPLEHRVLVVNVVALGEKYLSNVNRLWLKADLISRLELLPEPPE